MHVHVSVSVSETCLLYMFSIHARISLYDAGYVNVYVHVDVHLICMFMFTCIFNGMCTCVRVPLMYCRCLGDCVSFKKLE